MSYKFDFEFLAERWPDFVAGAWLTIACTTEAEWGALAGVVGPTLTDDPRFSNQLEIQPPARHPTPAAAYGIHA